MSCTETFWNLLERHEIKVPIIQRDFAQGRTQGAVPRIRENFVSTLIEMVKDKSRSTNLDFIYGTTSGGVLTPLDGQQRLTTLFLLHWYLALGSKDPRDKILKLKRFSYATRQSSRDFCRTLLEKSAGSPREFNRTDNVALYIEDRSWFLPHWKKDPTVAGMLVMLHSVQQELYASGVVANDELWEKLVSASNPPITFSFLDMGAHGLTNSLYVRMNGRGRSLTDFDAFKARLQYEFGEQTIANHAAKTWKQNLDGKWLHLFWKLIIESDEGRTPGGRCERVDSTYLGFFRNLALDFPKALLLHPEDRGKQGEDLPHLTVAFETLDTLAGDSESDSLLARIDAALKPISLFTSKNEAKDRRFTNLLLAFCKSPTLKQRLLFRAIAGYLNERGKSWEESELRSRARILRNLAEDIELSEDDLARTIDAAIRLLLSNSSVDELAGFVNTGIFSDRQLLEEIDKLRLIEDEPYRWDDFLAAENHSFFRGRIDFLIELASANGEGDHFDASFREHTEICRAVFDDTILSDPTKRLLLRQALFTLDLKTPGFSPRYPFFIRKHDSYEDRSFGRTQQDWRSHFLVPSSHRQAYTDADCTLPLLAEFCKMVAASHAHPDERRDGRYSFPSPSPENVWRAIKDFLGHHRMEAALKASPRRKAWQRLLVKWPEAFESGSGILRINKYQGRYWMLSSEKRIGKWAFELHMASLKKDLDANVGLRDVATFGFINGWCLAPTGEKNSKQISLRIHNQFHPASKDDESDESLFAITVQSLSNGRLPLELLEKARTLFRPEEPTCGDSHNAFQEPAAGQRSFTIESIPQSKVPELARQFLKAIHDAAPLPPAER